MAKHLPLVKKPTLSRKKVKRFSPLAVFALNLENSCSVEYLKKDFMKITHDILDAGRSFNGGWTKKQLKIIGVSWPPPEKWKRNLVESEADFPEKVVQEFISHGCY